MPPQICAFFLRDFVNLVPSFSVCQLALLRGNDYHFVNEIFNEFSGQMRTSCLRYVSLRITASTNCSFGPIVVTKVTFGVRQTTHLNFGTNAVFLLQKQFSRLDIACPFPYIVRPNVTQTKNCNVAKLRDSCQVFERPLDVQNIFQPFVPGRVYLPELYGGTFTQILNVSDLFTHYLPLRYPNAYQDGLY